MRDLTRVIEFVCQEVIPIEQTILIQALKSISQRAMYLPPESLNNYWRDLAITLTRYVGAPVNVPWKIRLGQVIRDEEKIPGDWKHVS